MTYLPTVVNEVDARRAKMARRSANQSHLEPIRKPSEEMDGDKRMSRPLVSLAAQRPGWSKADLVSSLKGPDQNHIAAKAKYDISPCYKSPTYGTQRAPMAPETGSVRLPQANNPTFPQAGRGGKREKRRRTKMRFPVVFSGLLAAVVTLAGCEPSKVSEKDIQKQKDKIAKLEKELKAAKEKKEQATETVSGESRKKAEEKINELESQLQKERDQLTAMQERYTFENEMVDNLQEMDKKIDQLSDQAKQASGQREVELNKQVAALKTKRDQLRDKLNELRAASGDTWAKLKTETEDAWKDANNSIDEAMKNLKKDIKDEVKGNKTSEPGSGDESQKTSDKNP